MKRRIWILTAIICLAVCLAGVCLCGAFAEQETITATGSAEGTVDFRVKPEAAEEAYIRSLFGLPVTPVDELPKTRGTTGGDLLGDGTPEKGLYTALKALALEVAAGTRTSTEFTFQNEAFMSMLTYSDEDLGFEPGTELADIIDGDLVVHNDAGQALQERFSGIVKRAFNAVMFDCPYEMFWMNKGDSGTYGAEWRISWRSANGHQYLTIPRFTIGVVVSGSYAGSGDYTTDGNKISAMVTAAANAHAIINKTEYDGYSAEERLKAYRDEICTLTEYNDDAAEGDFDYEYGDPWQLVWVFDNDPDTTVVCEGYSKAFMYLCDETKSKWGNDDVTAVCVSGEMTYWKNGMLKSGPHMWNIVTLNGVNYLVDVTNCDEGELFMDGYEQKDSQGNTYIYETAGGDVTYTYDTDTIRTFGAGNKLNLTRAGVVTLVCEKQADDQGIISVPVHGKLRFTVRADGAIRNDIRGARLMISGWEEGLNPFELSNWGSTSFDWVPNDEFAADMVYTVTAQVLTGEGSNQTWNASAPVTVHVMMEDVITGDLTFQTDDRPVEVPLDGMLNVYVSNIGADYYGCYIEENGEWIADSRWVIANREDGGTEVCMPVFRCTPGTTYDAYVYAVKVGAQTKVAGTPIQVTVTPKVNTEAAVILDVQDKEDDDNPGERICLYTTEERIRVYALYENPNNLDEETSWVRVRVYEKGNRGHQITEEEGDGFYYWTDALRIGEPGTYIIEAEVVQVPDGDWSQPARYVAGTRTRREITVTADEGKLRWPEIKIPAVASANENFVIRMIINEDDMIDRYSFWISRENDNQWLAGGEISKGQYNHADLWSDELQAYVYDFVIPAGTLEADMQYRICVDTFARGYTQGHSEYIMMLTGDPETDEDVISISGPAQIRFSEQFTIHAEAPGAQQIIVRCETTNTAEYGDYGSLNIANCKFTIDWDPGEDCRFTAIAMYEDGTIKVSPTITIPFERTGSEIPAATAPSLSLDNQDADDIHAGQFIRALVGDVDNATEYIVVINDPATDKWVQTTTSPDAGVVPLSTSSLKKDYTYELLAYAHVPGTLRGLSQPVEFTVTDADVDDTGIYLKKNPVEVMEELKFSIVAPGAENVRYATDSYDEEYYWEEAWNWNGESFTQGITYYGSGEDKTITAQAYYEDLGWVTIGVATFSITNRGELENPAVYVPEEVTESEDLTIYIPEVEGAEEYTVNLVRWDGKNWYYIVNPGVFTLPGSCLYTGAYSLYVDAQAYGYEPGYVEKNFFVVENKPEPHITIPAMMTEGIVDGTQAFSVTVDLIPGATDYCLEIHEAGAEDEDPVFSRQEQAAYEALEQVTFTVSAGTLAGGRNYRVTCYVSSDDPDFHDCSASKTILCWSGDLDSGVEVEIEYADPDQLYFSTGDGIWVYVTAPDEAKAVIIRCGGKSYGFAGHTAEYGFAVEEPGEMVLYAQAYYTDEEDPELPDDPEDPAWNNLAWGSPSVSRRKIILRDYIIGQAGQPYFTLPDSVVRGDILVVDVLDVGACADEVHANINLGTQDNEGEWVFRDWCGWNAETGKIYIPTAMLEPGDYWLALENSGAGYMSMRNWEPFEVTERKNIQAGDILLNVPDRITEGDVLPVSIYAPGATQVGFGTDLNEPDDPNDYETLADGEVYYDMDGIRLDSAGEYTVYAGAQFADGWHFIWKKVEVQQAADPGLMTYCYEYGDTSEIHVLLNEDLTFGVYSEYGGTIQFCCGDDIQKKIIWAYEGSEFNWHAGETGEYQAYVKMWLPDEEDEEEGRWIYSNRYTIYVELADPMPVFDPLTYTVTGSIENIPRDGVLTIEVDNIDADFYGAYVTDGSEGEWICDTHWVSQEWATNVTLLHLPLIHCEPGDGHDYRVHVYAVKYGVPWFEAETVTPITVADTDETDNILISMNDNFVVSAPICFYACYTGTEALPEDSRMVIRVRGAEDEDDWWYHEEKDPMNFWESNLRIGMRGTYVLTAEVRGWDEELGDERVYGTATRTFQMITNPETNDLEAEFVTTVKDLMSPEESKRITFSYSAVNAQHSSVEIVRIDDEYGNETMVRRDEVSLWYEDRDDERIPHINGENIYFSVDANGVLTYWMVFGDGLYIGEYEIRICTDAWNWQTATLNKRFTVAKPTFKVYENGTMRTVNDAILSGDYYYKIYISDVDSDEWFGLSYGEYGSNVPYVPEEDLTTERMAHDEHGAYTIVLPPYGDTNAMRMFGRMEEADVRVHTDLAFNRDKVGTSDDVILTFTEENTPVLMQPYTLIWDEVEGADAYILHWRGPEGINFTTGWISGTEYDLSDVQDFLSMPGEYTVQITALAGGWAIDYPAATFTAAATEEFESEVTFTPAPSETPIEIARNGLLEIRVNNMGADFYGAYAVDPDDRNGGRIIETGWVYAYAPDSGITPLYLPLAETLDGREFEAGDRLEVHVYAGKFGAGTTEAKGTLMLEVTDEVLTGGLFRADLPWDEASQSYLVPAYSDFSVLMYMPGACDYALYYDGNYLNEYYGAVGQASDCEADPGLHELRFEAYGEEGHELGCLSIRVTGTADGESGIHADVNPVFTLDPDGFSFTVWNLYKAENEYWEIRLKDRYRERLWSYGSKDNGYVEPAPEDPEEEAEQCFQIPTYKFEDDDLYFLTIEAHVEGKNPFRQTWAIKVTGNNEEFSVNAITLTVNGQDKTAEGPVGTDALIAVEAPGSTAVRIYMPGRGWECLYSSRGGSHYEWQEKINEGEAVYYAEACYDEDPDCYEWDELNWTCGSNAVTVRGIISGETEAPRVTLAGGAVDEETGVRILPRGGTLTVTIDAPEAPDGWPEGIAYPYDANRFGLWIEDSEGHTWSDGRWVDDVTSFPVKVGLNTASLEMGEEYRVSVTAQAPGKDDTDILSEERFAVTEPATVAPVTLEIMKEPDAQGVYHVLQGEHVQALGTAPGAECVIIASHSPADGNNDEFDTQLWSCNFENDYEDSNPSGNCFNIIRDLFSRLEPGTYEIYAATGDYNFDGTYLDKSSRLTVSVEMQTGNLLRPVIQTDAAGTAVNPGDALTFSVANLAQPGVNNWEVTVEEDVNRWDRQTVFHRTNRSYTVFDDDGIATFTVPEDAMTAGKRYVIRAWVCGIGYERQEDSVQILAGATESEPRLELSASKTSVDVKEEFNITIRDTADPADEPDEITAIQVNRGDGWWKNVELRNGEFRDTHHFDEPGTMMVSVRYTTDVFDPDEIEDWDDLNWTYSAAVKMTATVSGTMPKPVCALAADSNHFRTGDIVEVTLTDPEGEAFAGADFGYYVEIDRAFRYEDSDDWGWSNVKHINVPGRAKTLMIPTRGLQAGKYFLTVGMYSQGYTDTHTEMIIWIEEPDQPEDPESIQFIVDRTELKTHEEASLYLYAEDAWRVEVDVTRQDDSDWRDQRREDWNEGFMSWSANEAGTYILTPVAYHYDGTITTGDPETVRVTATYGTLNITGMTMASTLAEGSELTVTVTATQTDTQGVTTPAAGAEMHVHLCDVSGYQGVDVTGYDVRLDENGQGTVTFEAEWFEQGRMYCANADVSRKGFEGAHAEKRMVTIPADPDMQHTVTLTVDGKTDAEMQIPSSREITVYVNAPGATAVKVMRENTWMCETGESTEGRWGYGDGDKIIVAMACYDDPESWPEDWYWEDLNWTGVSNVINVHVQNAGKLGEPDFRLNKDSLTRGEMLEVSIQTDPDLPEDLHVWYYADVAEPIKDGYGRITSWDYRGDWHWDWDENTRKILINTAELDPGEYRIVVGIDAVGWEGTTKYKGITLNGLADGTFVTDLPDDAQIPIYSDREYHVMISGADGIFSETLRLNKETGSYETCSEEQVSSWNDYGSFEMNFYDYSEGSYRIVFRGNVNGETVTESVDFTVISYGRLSTPKIVMSGPWTSGDLVFRVDTQEEGTWLNVEVNDYEGWYEQRDGEDHNQCFSADLFETGRDYTVSINHSMEGYYPSGSQFRVRRIAANKTMTLPAALQTIEDEAFMGIGAELVIFPDNAVSIGQNAFAECDQLKAVYIPDSVTTISDYAFGAVYPLTVYGKTGSEAEAFAGRKDFDFVAVD